MTANQQAMEGNEQLEALMLEAGFLKRDDSVGLKKFARAVTACHSKGKEFTHTYVRRWLNGTVPRKEVDRNAILTALSKQLGRRIRADEIGFESPKVDPDLGIHYPDTVSDGIASLRSLWRADLAGSPDLLAPSVRVAPWNDATLSWLVGMRHDVANGSGAKKVTAADVEALTDMTDMYDRMDGQHGGGHARRSLLEFLDTDVPRLIGGRYSSEVAPDLYRAVAQATLLGAWMSYDAGLHAVAQRYFIQALGIAQGADDRLLGASILDAMSHQATFKHQYREAANMARAAQQAAAMSGSHLGMAHFAAMEARALARLGDAVGCDRALSRAVREYERANFETDPAQWLRYFNESELNAERSHCNRDLGRAAEAVVSATESLGPTSSGYIRSDFFVTMVLADAQLDQGDVDQACATALEALEVGSSLKSARCGAYVGEFRERLEKVGQHSAVNDFVEQASAYKLWTPADSRRISTPGDSPLI